MPQPLDPELRAAAEAQYAAMLANVADNSRRSTRSALTPLFDDGPPDWKALSNEMSLAIDPAAQVGADLAAANLTLLTGVEGEPGTAVIQSRRFNAVQHAYDNAIRGGADHDVATARALDQADRIAANAVFDGAAQGSEAWVFTADDENGLYQSRRGQTLWLRRVSPGEVCGLCIQAATRVYKTPLLRPIHDHCRCTVRPVLAGEQIRDLFVDIDRLRRSLNESVEVDGLSGRKSRTKFSNSRLTI